MQGFEAPEVELDPSYGSRWQWLSLPYLFERGGIDLDSDAIVFEKESRSYRDLRERSRRLANALIGLGLNPRDRVAVLSMNRLEYVEIEMGISMVRGIMVALNWRLRAAELASLLRRSGARAIFVEEPFVGTVNGLRRAGEVPDLRTIIALGDECGDLVYEELSSYASAAKPQLPASLEDPHEIIFTTVGTSEPKGVVWSDGTVIWNAIQQVMDYQLGPEHRTYAVVDMHYLGGRHDFTWPILYQGGVVHVKRSGSFDADAVMRYLAEHAITHVLWVPAMLYEILRLPELERYDLSALKMIMCGGQAVSAAATERAQAAFPDADFIQVYGLADGGATVSFMPPRHTRSRPGSAGKPSQHVELRIVDEHGADLPPNVEGEIIVRAPSVAAGYWADASLAELIIDGFVHTGDVGRLDEDGFLYISGRRDEMIVTGGMNVFPAEIEDVLRMHPAVSDAAVIGMPDEKWGESVCAVVQTRAGGPPLEESDLITYCHERLAGFKKPTSVHFVEELPRTAAGHIEKSLLRRQFGGASVSPLP